MEGCSRLQVITSSPGLRPRPLTTMLIPSVVFCWSVISWGVAVIRPARARRAARLHGKRLLDVGDDGAGAGPLPARVEICQRSGRRDLGADGVYFRRCEHGKASPAGAVVKVGLTTSWPSLPCLPWAWRRRRTVPDVAWASRV